VGDKLINWLTEVLFTLEIFVVDKGITMKNNFRMVNGVTEPNVIMCKYKGTLTISFSGNIDLL
jgi:hypothetical protein